MRSRELVTVVFGWIALAAAVLLVGGADRWAQAIVAGCVGAALATQLTSRRVFTRLPPLVVLILVALGLTLLQLIPLPAAVISALDPVNSTLRTDGAALVDTSPWQALTMDVAGTLRAAAFLTILLGVAVVAVKLALSERGRYLMLASVAAIAGLTAVIVGIHALLGLHSLYGLYKPAHATPLVLGPLLNENHLGCLMAMGSVTAIGLMMYRRQRSIVRALWLLVVAACGATTLATMSRGATLSFFAGAVVAVAILIAQRFFSPSAMTRRASLLTRSLPAVVVAICAVVVVLYASSGGVTDQLTRTSVSELDAPHSKFAAWRSSTTLIEESPWVGVGRGAFEPTFTRVHPASAVSTFSHLENEYLQAVVDWGVPGAVLLGILTLWAGILAARRWRDGPLAASALGAIAVVALQSNVDFAIELLGVAVPFVLVLATVTYVPRQEVEGRVSRMRALRIAQLASIGVAIIVLLSASTTTLREDHDRISGERAATLQDLHATLQRHPNDYFGYAVAAQAMLRNSDPRAIAVLNHALELHPTHPGLHLLAAHLLYSGGHLDQAALEYASALRGGAHQHALLEEVCARFKDAHQAASAIPAEEPRIADVVSTLTEFHRVDVAFAWLERVLHQKPGNPRACELVYTLAAQQGSPESIGLASKICPQYDLGHDTRLALAKALAGKHADAQIVALLSDVGTWSGRVDNKLEAWLALCDAETALSRWDDARACLRRLDNSGLAVDNETIVSSRLEKIHLARPDADTPH